MSPVAPASGHASRAMILTFAVVVVGMLLVWGASVALTSRHNNRVQTEPVGGEVNLGDAKSLRAGIDKGDGAPIFFPDVSGNNARGVYINHEGDDLTTGWVAFLAQVPGEAADCLWQWDQKSGRFTTSCDSAKHADAMGTGLKQYPVHITEGRVKVDLTVRDADATSSGDGTNSTVASTNAAEN